MALDPMPDEIGVEPRVYRDRVGGGLWEVIGYINDPAVILRKVDGGQVVTEVIGCANAERWVRLKAVGEK